LRPPRPRLPAGSVMARPARAAAGGADGRIVLGGVIARYGDRLPLTDRTPRISLNEGDTPLIRSLNIGPELGLRELYFKFQGLNPTGSFKDRGMVGAVAKALEGGRHTLVCASTSN